MTLDLALIGKLLLSALLGSAVGFEREKKHKPAGLRTYMLVCLGSCLITIVSLKFTNDSARIASGIITGIGFLCAGAIIAHGKDVRGLTTAAGIWTIAAVGLAVGVGEYVLAVVTTTLVYIILKLSRIESEI
jgi:putative Mg2+ transporter-C (MgtC) family protein